MTGLEVKEKLVESGYKLSDIAQNMNITPQSLHKFLLSEDIKTGVLERIAKAINKDIMFFFGGKDNNGDDIKLTNEIVSRERQLYFLYQKIVDVSILNTDYLKITQAYEVDKAAEIMNNFLFPEPTYKQNEKGELETKVVRWKDFDSDRKKLYNAELGESVRILQDIFFERFKLLYDKTRGFGQFENKKQSSKK